MLAHPHADFKLKGSPDHLKKADFLNGWNAKNEISFDQRDTNHSFEHSHQKY